MKRLEAAVETACGEQAVAVERLAGGDISGACRVRLSDGRTVVVKSGPLVSQEADMLLAMHRKGAPVPEVIGVASGWLVLEDLGPEKPSGPASWPSIADALEPLRGSGKGEDYGWPENYAFRDVAVINTRQASWVEFWRENRLLCHLPALPPGLAKRVEALAERLPEIIPDRPHVSLLHGDLWGGNVVWDGATAWLIDPCAYYGDREVDVAALTVFDSPPQSFFDRLDLQPGWRERMPVYRLWMWLLHVRLFGDSYRSAAERDLALLGC